MSLPGATGGAGPVRRCAAGAVQPESAVGSGHRAGRLYGIVHDSVWCHLSRPEDLPAATRALRLAREPDAAERDAAS
jgi:hypothetical protein